MSHPSAPTALAPQVLKALRDYDTAALRQKICLPHPVAGGVEAWAALESAVSTLLLAHGEGHFAYGPSFLTQVTDAIKSSSAVTGREEVEQLAMMAKSFGNEELSRCRRSTNDPDDAGSHFFACCLAFCAGAALAAAVKNAQLEAICWTNMAIASAEQQQWKASLDAAVTAIATCPKYLKGYYRAADAAFALGDKRGAEELFSLGRVRAEGEGASDYMALRLKWSPPVKCVRVVAGGAGMNFNLSAQEVPATDPIFSDPHVAAKSPVLWLIGLPFMIKRLQPDGNGKDCQLGTYMMINPETGFARPPWMGRVGDLLIFRQDREDVSVGEVYGLWDWFNSVLDRFGDCGEAPREGYRAHFIEWQFSYNASMQGDRAAEEIHLLEPTKAESDAWYNAEA